MNAGALTVATLQNTNQDGLPTLPGGWGSGNIAAVTSKITNGYVGPTRGLFVGSGVPYLQSLHIKANGIKFEPEYFVTEDWSRQHKKSVLAQGDVLVVQTGDIGQVALVPPLWTGANCHALIILAPNENVILGSYLSWVLNSSYGKDCLLSRQTGALHPHLNCSAVREIQVPIPPLTAQNAIASFLDRKTAAIDALIEKKQKLVELLAEKRAALINQAVTKGLDPNVPMKESGIPWIGDVPAHWDYSLLRLAAQLESGHTPSRNRPDYWVSSECSIPWFSLADVWQLRDGRQRYLGETAEKVSPTGISNSSARVLPAGTVVLSRTASVGFSGIMPVPMATTQDFANWICGPRLTPDYLWWAFQAMRPEFDRLMMGSTHQTIYMPDLRQIKVPLPSIEEQARINNFLENKTSGWDSKQSALLRSIARLQEYRQALITAAVTGQLDIPEAPQ